MFQTEATEKQPAINVEKKWLLLNVAYCKFIEIYCNHCSHIVFHLFLLYIYNIVTYCKVQSCYAYTMRI